MSYVFLILLFLTAVFLILLILVQRGKGGGLAGALGGMGGQSAFGTKAGDTFTRITIGVAAFWILLCVLSALFLGTNTSRLKLGGPNPVPKNSAPAKPGAKPAGKQGAAPASEGTKSSPATNGGATEKSSKGS
jgi:preprotein translocase subunit SecG